MGNGATARAAQSIAECLRPGPANVNFPQQFIEQVPRQERARDPAGHGRNTRERAEIPGLNGGAATNHLPDMMGECSSLSYV